MECQTVAEFEKKFFRFEKFGDVQLREGMRCILIDLNFDLDKFLKRYFVLRSLFIINDEQEDELEKDWL